MKIYIAGKITGLEWSDVVAKFTGASRSLKHVGHTPLCPVEMFPENPVWDWPEYLLADLRVIFCHADALLMLDNWKDSKGASLEHHAAELVGKPIYYSLDEVPVNRFCGNCGVPITTVTAAEYYSHCSYPCLKATEVRTVAEQLEKRKVNA